MDELIGKTVGGYEIQRMLGQGGMARVYLARQQSMNRQVALKVLPKQFLVDDTYLQRFEREVKIVSQLEHRNIIPVYDYGESDGQPYIVMRYMPSGTVDDLLKQGAMSPEGVLSIISQIAPALDYAHTKEVLHRDLKPSNVLMDDNGGAFLTDFGIARLSDGQGTAITTQGVVGTPSYMSPEQAQGKSIDGRSDVYSLGVMLFEMMTGRRPFEADTPYSIAVMQVTTPPPQPRTINPSLSPAIERVILKAMEKQPEDRYQTARDLMEALRQAIERPQHVDSEPVRAPIINQSPPVVVYQPPPPVPQPQPAPMYVPTPQPMQKQPTPQPRPAYPNHPSSGSVPAYQTGTGQRASQGRLRRNKPANPLTSMLLGVSIGCGLLLFFGLVGVLVIAYAMGRLNPAPAGSSSAATEDTSVVIGTDSESGAPTARPTNRPSVVSGSPAPLDLTSDAARLTQVGADADAGDTPPTAAYDDPTAIPFPQELSYSVAEPPALLQTTPSLMTALGEVGGMLLFSGGRVGPDGVDSFKVLTLNLGTWEETALTKANTDSAYPQASPDGQWIVFQSDVDKDEEFDIYIMKNDGTQLHKLTVNDVVDRLASWSPDGEWIIYSSDVRNDGNFDLYRVRPSGADNQLVYSSPQRKSHARYSPDGRYIVFTSGDQLDASTWEILRYDLRDGSIVQLTNNDSRDASPLFSPDGQSILYITTVAQGNEAIAVMGADGSNPHILYNSPGSDWAASYSPDGKYIAFSSNMNGGDRVFLMTSDGMNVQQIISQEATYPSWLPNS